MNAERMLRGLVKHGLGGSRRRRGALGGLKGKLGLGALGVAIAAFEHFTSGQSGGGEGTGSISGATSSTPPDSSRPPEGFGQANPLGRTQPPPRPPAPGATARASAPPPPPPVKTAPVQPTVVDDALILIRAMISAANADGSISEEERQAMTTALMKSGGSQEDLMALEREIATPVGLAGLLQLVRSHAARPDLAVQVYASSLLAIEVDCEAERSHLRELAAGLELDEEQVGFLHQQLDAGGEGAG